MQPTINNNIQPKHSKINKITLRSYILALITLSADNCLSMATQPSNLETTLDNTNANVTMSAQPSAMHKRKAVMPVVTHPEIVCQANVEDVQQADNQECKKIPDYTVKNLEKHENVTPPNVENIQPVIQPVIEPVVQRVISEHPNISKLVKATNTAERAQLLDEICSDALTKTMNIAAFMPKEFENKSLLIASVDEAAKAAEDAAKACHDCRAGLLIADEHMNVHRVSDTSIKLIRQVTTISRLIPNKFFNKSCYTDTDSTSIFDIACRIGSTCERALEEASKVIDKIIKEKDACINVTPIDNLNLISSYTYNAAAAFYKAIAAGLKGDNDSQEALKNMIKYESRSCMYKDDLISSVKAIEKNGVTIKHVGQSQGCH